MIRRFAPSLALFGLLAAGGILPAAHAQDSAAILAQLDRLKDPAQADEAVAALVAIGEPAVKHLLGEAYEGAELSVRGWAIVCLAEIGGEEVGKRMQLLQEDAKQPQLVRTWAAAARVHLAETLEELMQLSQLISSYPPLGRPISQRLLATGGNDPKQTGTLIRLTLQHPQLTQALSRAILARGIDPLVHTLLRDPDQRIRRQAAGFLGSLAQQGEPVAAAVAKAYAFDPQAQQPPWEGGPLFLPGLSWEKAEGTVLVDNLVRWYLWAERFARQDLHRQIYNNLQSIGLARVVGYQVPGLETEGWLRAWGQVVGRAKMQAILEQQGVLERYAKVLEELK